MRTVASSWRSGLVRVGVALVLVLFAKPQASAQAIPLVDIATDATDPSNLGDTEPSIAVNPRNPNQIAVVTFSEGWGPTSKAPVWKSDDGGTTWRKVPQLPQPSVSSGGPGDQKIGYDGDGKLFVAELAGGLSPPRCFIFRQTAGPDDPLTPGTTYGDDQPHLGVDQQSSGACPGLVYSPWLDFSQPHERSTVTKTDDGGLTLSNVGAGDISSFANRTSRIALASDGKAYVVYKTREGATSSDFEKAHFRVMRSDDCGATWNALGAGGVPVHGTAQAETFFTVSFGNPAKGKVARARSSDAWVAVNPTNGDVYAAYVHKDTSGFGQVYVARSTDRGATWTSHSATNGSHHRRYPEIAVTRSGAVGLLYIDYDDSGPATLFRHHLAQSFDNGVSWSDEVLQSMDPGPLDNAVSGFLWGDYEDLTAVGNTFYGVFTGQSIGRTTPQLDPIFFKVAVDPCRQLADEVDRLEQEISDLEDAFAAGEIPPPPRTPRKVAQFMKFLHSLELKLRRERTALAACRRANP